MSELQIKTLELLIIGKLQNPDPNDSKFKKAFQRMYAHFADEEYLTKTEHEKIIKTIYFDYTYKYKTVESLSKDLHIDKKTLLKYRKYYVFLFAKYYLEIPVSTNTVKYILYTELTKSPTEEKQTIG